MKHCKKLRRSWTGVSEHKTCSETNKDGTTVPHTDNVDDTEVVLPAVEELIYEIYMLYASNVG